MQHIIRAAAEICEEPDFIVIGSQAVHGSDTTATLPAGWQDCLIRISGPLTQNIHGFEARGWCLDLHDLVISKLVAGRDKDIAFFRALVRMHEIELVTLRERLAQTSVSAAKRRIVESYFEVGFEDVIDAASS